VYVYKIHLTRNT